MASPVDPAGLTRFNNILDSISLLQRLGGCDSTQEALQDVDDWELTELNPDWDVGESGDNISNIGESGDDVPSPLPPLVCQTLISEVLRFLSR